MNFQQIPGQNKRSSQLLEIDHPAPYLFGDAFPSILDTRLGPKISSVPLSDSDSDRVRRSRNGAEVSTSEYSVLSVYEDELQSGDTVEDPNEANRLNLRLSLTAVPAVGGQRHAYLMNFGGLAAPGPERVIQYASGTEEWLALQAMNELLGEFSARHAEFTAGLQCTVGRSQNGTVYAASQPARTKSHLQTPSLYYGCADPSASSPPGPAVERRYPATAQQIGGKQAERSSQGFGYAASANGEYGKAGGAQQHSHAICSNLRDLDRGLDRSGCRFYGADAERAMGPEQLSLSSSSGCVLDCSEDL